MSITFVTNYLFKNLWDGKWDASKQTAIYDSQSFYIVNSMTYKQASVSANFPNVVGKNFRLSLRLKKNKNNTVV
jgi:hypothetical protein